VNSKIKLNSFFSFLSFVFPFPVFFSVFQTWWFLFRLAGELLSLSTATKKVTKENAAPIARPLKDRGCPFQPCGNEAAAELTRKQHSLRHPRGKPPHCRPAGMASLNGDEGQKHRLIPFSNDLALCLWLLFLVLAFRC